MCVNICRLQETISNFLLISLFRLPCSCHSNLLAFLAWVAKRVADDAYCHSYWGFLNEIQRFWPRCVTFTNSRRFLWESSWQSTLLIHCFISAKCSKLIYLINLWCGGWSGWRRWMESLSNQEVDGSISGPSRCESQVCMKEKAVCECVLSQYSFLSVIEVLKQER